MEVEFLPPEELEDLELLEAISEEWTGAASIAEAIRLHRAIRGHVESMQGLKVCILGPSSSCEYHLGIEVLEEKLLTILGDGDLQLMFCGPEVPTARSSQRGKLQLEHRPGLWHEQPEAGVVAGTAAAASWELFIALNAGTSLREYQEQWRETFMKLPQSSMIYITGYNLLEVQEANRDLRTGMDRWPDELDEATCRVCRSGTLKGFDRVELGTTPASFPGKANYAECIVPGLGGLGAGLPVEPWWPIFARS
ncbi:unnamed protein product [Durusdinium trenchii]